MAITYTAIANTTLGSNTNIIQISSIPSTFTDLRVTFSVATTVAAAAQFTINGITSGNAYAQQIFSAYGTGKLVTRLDGVNNFQLNRRANTTTSLDTTLQGWVDIFSYASFTPYKQIISFSGQSSTLVERSVGQFQSISAVNSVELRTPSNFLAGSRMAIYGILRA